MRVTTPKKMRRGPPKQRTVDINNISKKKSTNVQTAKNGRPLLKGPKAKISKKALTLAAKDAEATMKKNTTKPGKLGKIMKEEKPKTVQTEKKSPKTKSPKLKNNLKATVPEPKKKMAVKKGIALERAVKESVKTANIKEKDDSTLKATDGVNVQHKEKIAPKIETKAKQNTAKQAIMNKIDKPEAKVVKAVARKSAPKKDISLVDRPEANKPDTNIKSVEMKDKVVKETSKLQVDKKNTKTSSLETSDNKTKSNESTVDSKAETIAKLLKEANKTLLKGTFKGDIAPIKRKKKINDTPKGNPAKKVAVKKNIEPKMLVNKPKLDDLPDKKNSFTVKRKTENAKNFKKKIIETWSEKSKAEELQKQLKQELSDEALNLSLQTTNENHIKKENKPKIKDEFDESDEEDQKPKIKKQNCKPSVGKSPKIIVLKKRILKDIKKKNMSNEKEPKVVRRKKILGLGNGPKRHRVASLNALAKVHCLYENESRGAFMEILKPKRVEIVEKVSEKVNNVEPPVPSTRTLRSGPGVRGAGKHWDMHNELSSSDESLSSYENYNESTAKIIVPPSSYKQKQIALKKSVDKQKTVVQKQPIKKRRNCNETVMDLKDMVVRKRMASLNATAILAASYSPEKRSNKSGNGYEYSDTEEDDDDDEDDEDDEVMTDKRRFDGVTVKEEDDRKLISNKKKVAVIVNQDTDVTITGVYVNSTTRSTHLHEGYCSIAGMQYRISATSHTQTNATAVSTETLQLHSAANSEQPVSSEQGTPMAQPCKSYTPLGALSSMQPPGAPPPATVGPPLSPLPGRVGRHAAPCSSAFSAPPYGPPPPHHHHPPPKVEHPPPGYIHGYYQPAGPLISTHHPHGHVGPTAGAVIGPGSVNKISAPLPSLETSPSSPLSQQPPAPSSAGESSDNDVIITASTSSGSVEAPHLPQPPQPTYRYATSYPTTAGAPPGYAYSFPPAQYYTAPQYGPQQPPHYHHQDLCYTAPPYPTYFKAYAPPPGGYHRRYIPAPPPQYYPQDVFASTQGGQQTTQVVTAAVSTTGSAGPGGTFQSSSSGPPPTLVETFQPSSGPVSIVESYHGPHYYAGFNTAPTGPPGCYTHSPPTRSLAFIDPAYQSCPCPMQSCPKNVHTGPLTGDGKRSNMTVIAKESTGRPLLPVALALPLEPTSAGPPSPARGSAGMPPPPSPAGATYQPASTPKQEVVGNCSPALVDPNITCTEKSRRKARVGKNMVRNTIASHFTRQSDNTMLLMCHNPGSTVKREAISPEEDLRLEDKKEKEVESSQTQPSPSLTQVSTIYNVQQIDTPAINSDLERPCDRLKTSPNDSQINTSTDESKEVNNLSNEIQCSTEMLSNFKEELSSSPTNTEPVLSPSTDNSTNATSEKENTEIPFEESLTINQTIGTKRKLIDDEENKNTVQKKHKSSYKDLIKKPTETFKINNGKRKLNANKKMVDTRALLPKKPKKKPTSKTKLAKSIAGLKRKSTSPLDEDGTNTKKAKNVKALATDSTNMLQNTKPDTKSNKLPSVGANLGPNLSSMNKKSTVKKIDTAVINNSKKVSTTNVELPLKSNSVDQTIESVIQNSIVLEDTKAPLPPQNISKVSKENKVSLSNVNTNVPVTKSKEPECSKSTVINTRNIKNQTKITKKRNSKVHKTKEYIPCPISKVPRRSSLQPRWSNGWSWEGEPFKGKVFLNSDESVVTRTCYPAMRHSEGDLIYPRDCILLKSGPRKIDLPFVAKVASLWENPDDGEMMVSLLWYYRPEHTEQGRLSTDEPDEVFASRHKDTNSVACIEDKCYVLTFNEYCRYRKNARRIEEGLEEIGPVVPQPDGTVYPRAHRQPPSSQTTSPDMVFFCRRVYDFRQKRIVKNPS